mmetsp:Transcript_3601/g.8007  ORF Transcript_3601/g.8007 Transcript_3601/m.8007 type:complete len:207 (-) Transcript_3601:87-707(-)|eukprot:CAMPEP_0116839670 /NCGR_PEP_ID=MMETSP0418-20121206/9897_1 /TAXON_ID=1158023 /ORGANISM="Astrosyne radiata, Strain 13vi08-1A" /LENGTH=206 /DNA_ID=CAMNT_0004469809 /DNA_START=195 /DNA_END=815 /DNA_ORIENTATION=-
MKLAVFAAAVASAAAFQPASVSQTRVSTTALNVNELELGATPPLGFYDPLKYTEVMPESFERRRAVERKHGRIAMMAVVGTLVHTAHITFPGSITLDGSVPFSSIPDGVDGIRAVPAFGLLQILVGIGLMETITWPAANYSGDYGTGYFGQTLEGEELTFKLNVELNNGRAAMMGILGSMVAECTTGQSLAERIADGGKLFIPFAI